MGRLQDKVCLITGAARGQGAVEARLFASEGARVWLTDVRDAEGRAVAEETGGEYRRLDVRDAGAWNALVAELLDAAGCIDVLVNNAGIFQAKRLVETEPEDFEAVMAVNCTGVYLGMRAVAPAMSEAGRGSIVNISSIAGLGGARSAFAYSASKWAVRGMTKSAAFELGRRGVRVNSIHPGMIETEMLHQVAGTPTAAECCGPCPSAGWARRRRSPASRSSSRATKVPTARAASSSSTAASPQSETGRPERVRSCSALRGNWQPMREIGSSPV